MTVVRGTDASVASLPGVAALLEAVFPTAPRLDLEWLSWSYLANPLGPSVSSTAHAEDRVVAHLGGRWLRARVAADAPPEPGVLIHHAATDEAFRGRGLLVDLIDATLDRAASKGATFAVAVLNANSFHAFVRRAGFTALGPLSVRVGLGAVPARDPNGVSPTFEPAHDAAWLAWRLAAPGSPYRARPRSTGVELWADSGAFGIPVLIGEADAETVEHLPPRATRSPLRAFVGLDAARAFRGSAYLSVPLRLRPSPLQLVFRPLAPTVVPPDPGHVRFEAIDFDAW